MGCVFIGDMLSSLALIKSAYGENIGVESWRQNWEDPLAPEDRHEWVTESTRDTSTPYNPYESTRYNHQDVLKTRYYEDDGQNRWAHNLGSQGLNPMMSPLETRRMLERTGFANLKELENFRTVNDLSVEDLRNSAVGQASWGRGPNNAVAVTHAMQKTERPYGTKSFKGTSKEWASKPQMRTNKMTPATYKKPDYAVDPPKPPVAPVTPAAPGI